MEQRNNSIAGILAYIEEHLEEELTLDDLADRAGYSKFHLNRMFSEAVGVTIHKYIQTRRLTAAAEKLVNSAKPIYEIAYEAGYESQQAFTLAFRQVYACPPQAYRARGLFAPLQKRMVMLALYGGSYGGRCAA